MNQPGPGPGYAGNQATGGNVQNYLVWAILSTIFCCLPFGIVAIVFAAQVNSKLQAGDYAGAVDASKKARMWTMISVGAGLVAIVLYFLFVVVLGAASLSSPR